MAHDENRDQKVSHIPARFDKLNCGEAEPESCCLGHMNCPKCKANWDALPKIAQDALTREDDEDRDHVQVGEFHGAGAAQEAAAFMTFLTQVLGIPAGAIGLGLKGSDGKVRMVGTVADALKSAAAAPGRDAEILKSLGIDSGAPKVKRPIGFGKAPKGDQ